MAAGSLAGALLGALDLLTMVRMARKAAVLSPARASAVVRWVALGRVALIFLAMALGAMVLNQPAFLCMAVTYIAVRLGGLFVVAGRHSEARAEQGRGPACRQS
ncbi:MAG: hypothetical protein PWR07_966 [Bacillota bacterium]|nr:hypothetical protein [Bacillota bacterium]MDK2930835.1 hypothetical protein [Bacillota bacterium]